MTKSRTRRIVWRKPHAVLMLALLLLLYWCIPVTVSAEEVTDSGPSAVVDDGGGGSDANVESVVAPASESTGSPDIPEPVELATVLTPSPGSAEIVEVEVTGQDTNQLDNFATGDDPMETEFENDPASITVTETFKNQPGQDTTIAPDAVADETQVVVTETQQPIVDTQQPVDETQQPITESAEQLLEQIQDAGVEVNVDVERVDDTLIRTTVTESENAIQKAVSEALNAADGNTQSITIRVAAGEYNGDIQISKEGLNEDFTLYILADDSYTESTTEDGLIDKDTITTQSQSSPVLDGNILIAHINVIMAGLYLSQGNRIEFEDAEVTYNGTELTETFIAEPQTPPTGGEDPITSPAVTQTGTGSPDTEQTPAEPEPSIPEDQVEKEPYAIPEGSAYIYEISKEYQYKNTAESNAINDALEGALTYLRDLYTGEGNSQTERIATIVVQDGTYQGGIGANQSGSNSVIESLILEILNLKQSSADTSDMTIRIASHDSIEEDENGRITQIHAGSEGNVKVEGTIDIAFNGLNILLAGLYLSTRDAVNISNADSVKYFGTRQDDVVNLNVSGVSDEVYIDTGTGNDTVNADLYKQANVEAGVSIDEDLINSFKDAVTLLLPKSDATGSEIAGALGQVVLQLKENLVNGIQGSLGDISTVQVGVALGEGEDSANIRIFNSSDIVTSLLGNVNPENNKQQYSFSFAVDMTAADLQVSGGSGDDQISIGGGRTNTTAQELMQALMKMVNSELKNEQKLPLTSITLNGGLGDDVLTVDTTSAFSTWGGTSIQVHGQDGFDRLHLTGKLDDQVSEDQRITLNQDGTELTIKAMAQITLLGDLTDNVLTIDFRQTLKVVLSAIDALTDALLNKRTININEIQSGTKAQPFTNYVVPIQQKEATAENTNLTYYYNCVDFSLEDAGLVIPEGGVTLSNILISNDPTQSISGAIVVERLIVPGLNVLIMADIIDVTGQVRAKNLLLSAYGEDEALVAFETQIVEDDLNENSDLRVELGLYEADRFLRSNVTSTADIQTAQSVDMAVRLILNKAFLPGADILGALTGKDFNPVTLKFGKAEVNLFGKILAGGYIHAQANVDVSIDATNQLIAVFVPVSLAVSSGHAKVITGEDAVLKSGYFSDTERNNAGILLAARSSNDLVSYTYGGALKFSISLGVVEFETIAQITGNANVNAGGSVKLLASSIAESVSYATGKPSNVFNVDPQSGVFIAGNFILSETNAVIDGNATVTANQGDVVVDAFADSRASTVSLAIPFNNKPVSEQLTPFKLVPFVEKLIGVRAASNQSFKGKLLALVTGSNSLGNLLKNGTEAVPGDESKNQVVGALGVSYVRNDNLAKISTTGTVSASDSLKVHATGTTVSSLRADGSLYRTPSILDGVLSNVFEGGPYATLEAVPKNAIGAGIAVQVFMHNNDAIIENGQIQAKNLSVAVNALDADSSVVAKAGHTPNEAQTKLGIGGAITVHVANIYNNAQVKKNAEYQINGGDVEVIAKGQGTYVTVADASGKRSRLSINLGPVSIPVTPAFQMTNSSAGVGAGIAVEVINVDTLAQIEDDVSFGDNQLNSLNVEAAFDADFYIEAAAGSTGGTSVAPVMALSVSGVNTLANVGKMTGATVQMPGAVSVTANTSAVRKMIADAKAVGSRAGAGAAVGLSILDDSAVANLLTGVKAASVIVSADSISRISQTIYASAAGAAPAPRGGHNSYGKC